MAYTIGSSNGKKIAESMTVGSTYTASDGSTWKKQADGSVSVTHQGVTTNNAYKPTTSSGSSGGSSGSSSSGSSGGSGYSDRYASTNGDMGLYGKQQMTNGASWEEVLQTYNDRVEKASNDPNLAQFADDAIMQEMRSYIERLRSEEESQQYNKNSYDELLEYWNQAQSPYEKPYDPAMEAMLNQILNREDFSYDIQNDPLYQQYSAMYQQEGDRAMRETMAEAAASAGGMNSYAVTAAQQANNYYASQLGNKIPELYQLAYEMYLQDKESMVQDLGLLQGMDATQYNRYRDTMNDYYADKNFAYGMYRDDVADGQWEKNFNYGVSQDAINNSWKEKDYDLEKAKILAQAGNYEGYKALGYTDDEIESLKNSSSYGSAYVDVFNTVKEMKSKGKSRNEIINFLNGISEEELNTVGLQKILSYLGI